MTKSVALKTVLNNLLAINQRDLHAAFNPPSNGLVARAMSRFALIAAAGQLATTFGLTGWPEKSALDAAKMAFGEWLDAQEDVDQTEMDGAIERTKTYLIKYGVERFERAGLAPLGKRAGFVDTEYFYIDANAWREIHHGHDCNQAAKHLNTVGLLRRGEGKDMQRKTPLTLNGRSRGYAVRNEIIRQQPDSSVLPVPQSDMSDKDDDLGLAA